MAKSYEGLRSDASVIKNEVEVNHNTAMRVGLMFVDVINTIEQQNNLLRQDLSDLSKAFLKLIQNLTPQRVESEEVMDAMIKSGQYDENQIYYVAEE